MDFEQTYEQIKSGELSLKDFQDRVKNYGDNIVFCLWKDYITKRIEEDRNGNEC